LTVNTPAAGPQPGQPPHWAKRVSLGVLGILISGAALLEVAEHGTAKPDS
jgi:hypothetical protein